MKKISSLAIIVLVLSSVKLNLNAQHVAGLAPLSLINGVKVKYETPVAEYISAGSFIKATLWGVSIIGDIDEDTRGVRFTPFLRYYFKENLNGLYGQATAIGGYYNYFGEFGAGAGVGWQYAFPRNNHWSFDFGFGLQLVSTSDQDFARTMSQLFNGHFLVCYRF